MTRLEEVLTRFNAREANEKTIIKEFRKIAEVVFWDGYFLVNKKTKIYPVDIEFYLYGEKAQEDAWMQDKKMIHRKTGKDDVPYFPKEGSLYPHTFGIDVTFENPDKEYRASFLIRSYRRDNGKVPTHPSYLWEDMFGEQSFSGEGLKVIWEDEESSEPKEIVQSTRLNLKDEKKEQDLKPWRFYKKSEQKNLEFARTVGFPPLMCEEPKILILGTLPGGESLTHKQYYYSNSNRIWEVLCRLKGEQIPTDYEQKQALLAKHHIALWDYYQSAIRPDSSNDKDIRDGKPNDIHGLMAKHPSIKVIAVNGFGKYDDFGEQIRKDLVKTPALADVKVLRLPETSGSNKNHGWGDLNKLEGEWKQIFD